MTGSIRLFLPATRRGMLQTASGECIPFDLSDAAVDFQGGDLVEFEILRGERPAAVNVRLRQRWSERLREEDRPLVNAFHELLTHSG